MADSSRHQVRSPVDTRHGTPSAPTANGKLNYNYNKLCTLCSHKGHNTGECLFQQLHDYRQARGLCIHCGESDHIDDRCPFLTLTRVYRRRNHQCQNCGYPGHPLKDCPEPNLVCEECNRTGHHKVDCCENLRLMNGLLPINAPTASKVPFKNGSKAPVRPTLRLTKYTSAASKTTAGSGEDFGDLMKGLLPAVA